MPAKILELYAVQNHEGKWFRKIGYGGSGVNWTENFALARIYTKIGPARTVVGWWANHAKNFPVPNLVTLHIGEITIVNEKERIEKSRLAKEKAIAKRALFLKDIQN